jgi:hypothetical protein
MPEIERDKREKMVGNRVEDVRERIWLSISEQQEGAAA